MFSSFNDISNLQILPTIGSSDDYGTNILISSSSQNFLYSLSMNDADFAAAVADYNTDAINHTISGASSSSIGIHSNAKIGGKFVHKAICKVSSDIQSFDCQYPLVYIGHRKGACLYDFRNHSNRVFQDRMISNNENVTCVKLSSCGQCLFSL